MATEPRLVFGEVADLYDANRPSYPQQLIDDLLDGAHVSPATRVLEVGAGTGKATVLLAARGARVLAIEPSAEMAAVARRNCAPYSGVEIVESDFERWEPAGETFPLLCCAQAWHWIDPELRYRCARAALSPGGLLAAFWNRPAWGPSPLREALKDVYRRIVPDLPADGSLHPATESPDRDEDWMQEIAAAQRFRSPEIRFYGWGTRYSAGDYARLLATLSEIRLLSADQREVLLRGVRAAIAGHGGTLAMPLRTRVCLARAGG
jgi:SAM-dependent methyltransferase